MKENDILYHLGDWSFGGLNQIWEFRKRLNCKKIHLILGNHDHHIENNKYIQLEPTNENYLRTVDILGNGQMSCTTKQLFMEVRDKIRTRKIGGQEMTLHHFAQRHGKNLIMVHGACMVIVMEHLLNMETSTTINEM